MVLTAYTTAPDGLTPERDEVYAAYLEALGLLDSCHRAVVAARTDVGVLVTFW